MTKMDFPVSYSQLALYRFCAGAFKKAREFRDKLKALIADGKSKEAAELRASIPMPIPLLEGALAHKVYEQYFAHLIATDQDSDIRDIDPTARAAYRQIRDNLEPGECCLNEAQFQEAKKTIIVPWANRTITTAQSRGNTEVEVRLAFDAEKREVEWDSDDALIRMVIDRIEFMPSEKQVVVTDYKAGYADGDEFQLAIYAWGILNSARFKDSVHRVVAKFEYTRGHKHSKPITYSREFSLNDIGKQLFDEIDALVADWENDTLFCTPGVHCANCDFPHDCEKVVLPVGHIKEESQAFQTMENIELLERDLDLEKKTLRPWCVNHGLVTHNGLVYGFHTQGGDGFDNKDPEKVQKFANLFYEHDEYPWEFLGVNGTKAKQLFTRDGELKKDFDWLEPLVQNNRTEVFTKKKEVKA